MRIVAIDRIRDVDNGGESPVEIHLEQGDMVTVSDSWGSMACALGWVRDVDGNVPTGERRTGAVEVSPEHVISEQ